VEANRYDFVVLHAAGYYSAQEWAALSQGAESNSLNPNMNKFPLVVASFALLGLTQCVGPVYRPRYEGPPYATPNSGDPILGDPFYGYGVLRGLASSSLWCGVRAYELQECY
jgi:hypothetical protein